MRRGGCGNGGRTRTLALPGALLGAAVLGWLGYALAAGTLPIRGLGQFAASGWGIGLFTGAGIGVALGGLTGSEALLEIGRRTMLVAAASALISGLFGFVAQEAVEAEGEAHDLLVTHRTLNLGLVAMAALMARERWHRRRPSAGYLIRGFAGVGVMSYSAYLGGKMVYAHGLAVEATGRLKEGAALEIRGENIHEVARATGQNLLNGLRHALEHLRKGEVVPFLAGTPPEGDNAEQRRSDFPPSVVGGEDNP